MRAPVALLIFKRPDCTERVFEAIRQAKPPKLFVVADGPRPSHPDDLEKCAATRAIIDRVDWDCEVFKNFADHNLGCGFRPATGISWVFDHVEEAIILEDDCIPHPDFFRFCDELLERYRDDERVMHISGNNFWSHKYCRDESYLFSRYTLSWGWATWRRAWQHYDFEMKLWSEIDQEKQKNLLKDILGDQHTANSWIKIFQNITDTNLDCWDYQWILTSWLQGGLSILPHVNLVSNVGFGPEATHTFTVDNFSEEFFQLSVPIESMAFPLQHPRWVIRDSEIDRFIHDGYYDYFPRLPKRIRLKLNRIFYRKSGPEQATLLKSSQ
jgi:hypothetical protein